MLAASSPLTHQAKDSPVKMRSLTKTMNAIPLRQAEELANSLSG